MPLYFNGTWYDDVGAVYAPGFPAPTVTIAPASGAGYSGESIAFTATPGSGDGTYTYEWLVDGVVVSGETAVTYTHTITATLTTGVQCRVTSAGKTATSAASTITMLPALTCTIAPTSGAGYAGDTIAFTATPGGGDATYTYQWNVNDTPVSGQTAATYTHTLATNGEVVTCSVTSAGATVKSAGATMTVYSALGVTIAPVNPTVTEGAIINFVATPAGGDGVYTYQWKLDGADIAGATAAAYDRTTVLADNGKIITCAVTSAGQTATSAGSTMTVNQASAPISATGGTVTDSNGYRYHTFTTSGTFTVNSTAIGSFSNDLDALIVGGGGGGQGTFYGGGGGGGGMVEQILPAAVGALTVTVGAGGAAGAAGNGAGSKGGDSSVTGFTVAIGGGGGAAAGTSTMNGGCGGGCNTPSGAPGMGTAGQGQNGGTRAPANGGGGGGGGAGVAGSDSIGNNIDGGHGGNGRTWIPNGQNYGGGGGGGGSQTGGLGGAGGGGNGAWSTPNATPGTPNTGGGGGGGGNAGQPAAGGSGIVIIRYQIA